MPRNILAFIVAGLLAAVAGTWLGNHYCNTASQAGRDFDAHQQVWRDSHPVKFEDIDLDELARELGHES